MKKIFYILAIVAACSCAEKPDDSVSKLDDPVNLSAEQTDIDAVTLTWTDKAQGEKGYRVYKRNGNSNANTAPVVTLPADAVEYTFTGLTAGAVMDFGVQAIADDFNSHSNIVYAEDVRILTLDELYENGSVVRVAAPSEVSAVQEENKSSVNLASKIIKENKIQNVELHNMDAGLFFEKELKTKGRMFDVTVLDPPRKGCEYEVLKSIIDSGIEKIVYVSCNVNTQARDLKSLLQCYEISSPVYPFNLFPKTSHVESIVCLERKLND